MSAPISIALARPIAAVLADARKRAAAKGGAITGDAAAGSFTGATPLGEIAGTYRVVGTAVEVSITRRPGLVSIALIEGKLREFFA